MRRMRFKGERLESPTPPVVGVLSASWRTGTSGHNRPLLAYLLKPNTTEYLIPCLDRARLGLLRGSTFLILGYEQIVVARQYESYRQT